MAPVRKRSATRRALDANAAQTTRVETLRRAWQKERAEAEQEVNEARAALEESLTAVFLTDGSAASSEQAALHARLAKAQSHLDSPSWAARWAAIERAELQLRADRERASAVGLPDLIDEGLAVSGEFDPRLAAWIAEGRALLAERDDTVRPFWAAVEQAARVTQSGVRLDVPPTGIELPDEPPNSVPFQLQQVIDRRAQHEAQEAEAGVRTAQTPAAFVGDAENEVAA